MAKETQLSASIYINERVEHCWPFIADCVGIGEGHWKFSWSTYHYIQAERYDPSSPIQRDSLVIKVRNKSRDGFQLNISQTFYMDRASLAVFFLPLLKIRFRNFMRQLQQVEHLTAAFQRSEYLAAFPANAKPAIPADSETEKLADRLQSLTPGTKLSALLAEAILHWPELNVINMYPDQLASHWGAKTSEVIHLLFRAAADQILVLQWDVFCPICRRPAQLVVHLDHIHSTEKCTYCLESFDVELDKNVVPVFTPHPDVRMLKPKLYGAGHPATLPHILQQIQAQQDHPKSLIVTLEAGEYLVYSPERKERYKLIVQPDHTNKDASLFFGEEFHSSAIPLSPGVCTLHVELHTAVHKQIEVRLEKREEEEARRSAYEVLTTHEFHRWFPDQIVRIGTSWPIEQVTLLLCDIWHSTALYQTIGDETAMQLVEEHVDLVERETAAAGGTVVKVMGDTVMCAFLTAEQGLATALAIHRKHEKQIESEETNFFEIKTGVHSGPASMYVANGRIDYFGQTVNMAGLTHQAAARGEIVVSDIVYEQTENKRALQHLMITAHPFLQHMPGSAVPERLYRIKSQ